MSEAGTLAGTASELAEEARQQQAGYSEALSDTGELTNNFTRLEESLQEAGQALGAAATAMEAAVGLVVEAKAKNEGLLEFAAGGKEAIADITQRANIALSGTGSTIADMALAYLGTANHAAGKTVESVAGTEENVTTIESEADQVLEMIQTVLRNLNSLSSATGQASGANGAASQHITEVAGNTDQAATALEEYEDSLS